MTSNNSTTEVEEEEIEYKNKVLHFIHIAFALHYFTLTNYYIVKDTFRYQVIKGQ